MTHRMKLSVVFIQVCCCYWWPSLRLLRHNRWKKTPGDTGIITLGPDQFLRVSLAGDFDGDSDVDGADFVFRRIGYLEQGNIYRVASQVTSPRMRLSQGEAASIDISQVDSMQFVASSPEIS